MKNHIAASNHLKRRSFLQASGLVLGAAGFAASVTPAMAAGFWSPSRALIAKNDTVLFQGDSITDMGRSRDTAASPNNASALGVGYASLAGLEVLVDRPDDGLKVFNRGISGNKVYQLAERWDADCLDLKPNVLSILIGVNDIWHTLTGRRCRARWRFTKRIIARCSNAPTRRCPN